MAKVDAETRYIEAVLAQSLESSCKIICEYEARCMRVRISLWLHSYHKAYVARLILAQCPMFLNWQHDENLS